MDPASRDSSPGAPEPAARDAVAVHDDHHTSVANHNHDEVVPDRDTIGPAHTAHASEHTPPPATIAPAPQSDKTGGNFAVWNTSMEEYIPRRKRLHSEADKAPASETHSYRGSASAARFHTQGPSAPSSTEHTPALKRVEYQSSREPEDFTFLAPQRNLSTPRFAYHQPMADSNQLDIGFIEPRLVDILIHTWHLRTYIRGRKMAGISPWQDPIIINDTFGINHAILTWSCTHPPGSLQYPASMLYKQAVWIYFHRTIQPSRPNAAFKQVVDDGLHYLKSLPADHGVLLMPLTLLGVAAFDYAQRSQIRMELKRFEYSTSVTLVRRIENVCERIWRAIDEGDDGISWDWEYTSETAFPDPLLVPDPFFADIFCLPRPSDPRPLHPEHMDIDEHPNGPVRGPPAPHEQHSPRSGFRPSIPLLPAAEHMPPMRNGFGPDHDRRSDGNSTQAHAHRPTPSISHTISSASGSISHAPGGTDPFLPGWRSYSPRRGLDSIGPPPMTNGMPYSFGGPHAPLNGPRPSISSQAQVTRASPESYDSTSPHASAERYNDIGPRRSSVYSDGAFMRQGDDHDSEEDDDDDDDDDGSQGQQKRLGRSRAKIPLPPCSLCGKRFKNPSDEQKHKLQHEKPFRCEEADCTRTEGFATINDLQRHQVSVHRASLANTRKTGYICVACPQPPEGQSRKFWPRRDNFKAHIRRKHQNWSEQQLLDASETGRPHDVETESGYGSFPPTTTSVKTQSDDQ